MGTEEVVGGTVLDRERNDEEVHLCLSGSSRSVNIFYAFRDHRIHSDNGDKTERNFLQLARLDGWLATVLTYLEGKKRRFGNKQKVYANTFTSLVGEAVNPLIGQS